MRFHMTVICGVATAVFASTTLDARAQEGTVIRRTVEVIMEQISKKGGKEAAEELARIGGEKAVKEVVEKAAREGGEELAEKLGRYASEYGVAFLRGAELSPKTFISAFEELAPGMRIAAIQAIRREPELIPVLVERFGVDALEVAVKHPGVGTKLLSELGEEGAAVAKNLTTDEAIQLSKVAGNIAKLPSSERSQLLEVITRSPEKVLDLLERHPKVLTSGTLLAAFLASKDQALGRDEVTIGPDGRITRVFKSGLVERLLKEHSGGFGWLVGVLGLVLVCWATIRLWGIYCITKLKVASAAAKYAVQKEDEKHPK